MISKTISSNEPGELFILNAIYLMHCNEGVPIMINETISPDEPGELSAPNTIY